MRQLILGCLLVTLCGCATKPIVINNSSRFAATGSAFEGQGTVYMMRNLSRGGEAWPVQVELDGAMEGSLRRGTYVRIPVTPGRHNIVAHWSRLSGSRDVAMSVEFEAGKTYYFVIGTNFSNTPVYERVLDFV